MSTIINKQVKLTTGGSISFAQYSGGSITADSSNLIITGSLKNSSNIAYATEDYVNNYVQGLSVLASVRVATTTAGTLASDFENGGTIDGVTLVTGDRILIKNQSTASENGIYTVNASGAPSRASDFNDDPPIDNFQGAFIAVLEGTVNSATSWVCTTQGSVTLGTTAINFSQFSTAGTITAGTGLTKTGNTLSVNASQTQITELGTLTTGTWNASTITVPYGGTGATSFTANSILLGNGTSSVQASSGMSYSSNTLTVPKISGTDSTDATSSTDGALTIAGGVGIAKKLFIGSNVNSSSNSTGALVVSGGVGIGSALFVGGNVTASTLYGGTGSGNDLTLRSTTNGTKGRVIIDEPTATSSSSTGALVVSGGVGIGATDVAVSATNGGALTIAGGVGIGQNLIVNSTADITGNLTVNTDVLKVLSSGNVGIGTSSPGVKLQVEGETTINGSLNCAPSTSSGSGIALTPTASNYGNSALYINTTRAANSAFNLIDARTASSYQFVVRGDGKVAIGKGTPDVELDVVGDLVVSGAVSSPSIAIAASPVNITDNSSTYINVRNPSLVKLFGTERLLTLLLEIDPTTDNTTTTLEFTVPSVTTNFSTVYDIVANVNGFIGTDLVNIENCLIYPVTGTTKVKLSFTCGDATKLHYLSVSLRYTSN